MQGKSEPSPLTRGTQPVYRFWKQPVRFIPAYAGNSTMRRRRLSRRTVHPRLRGELMNLNPDGTIKDGSSPLTRGTLTKGDSSFTDSRFIPAYAGNSSVSRGGYDGEPVHPRLRGELVMQAKALHFHYRFIPAYAGNSRKPYNVGRLHAVHPRLRGELRTEVTTADSKTGSSPLTRGTPDS